MGKLIAIKRWVEESHLELTDEDWKLRDERRDRRHQCAFRATPTPHMRAFVQHLEKCPVCGREPRICGLWKDRYGFYSIKLMCCMENGLDCGDWYEQLSRAGLDWNYRVRHQRGEALKAVPHRYRCKMEVS